MNNGRKVVVTGIGLVTPLGNTVQENLEGLLSGRSGLGLNTKFATDEYFVKISGEVKGFNLKDYDLGFEVKSKRVADFTEYAIAAAHQAITDAKVQFDPDSNPRIGVSIGDGEGGLPNIEEQRAKMVKNGDLSKKAFNFVSRVLVPQIMPNAPSGNISMVYKLNGPNLAVSTACASGASSIVAGIEKILLGKADAMIVGGAEACITPLAIGSFGNAPALTKEYNDDPQKASRPFDVDRSGFVMAEGAGVLFIESLESALGRGAKIYAEIAGYAETGDGSNLTEPRRDARETGRAMKEAMQMAGISPKEMDYVNPHGTSTPLGDMAELRAIYDSIGFENPNVKISSTKSQTGHMIGAAGAAELIFCILGMQNDFYPATINLGNVDQSWKNSDEHWNRGTNLPDLGIIANEIVRAPMRTAISNSFGFGGPNVSIVLKRYEGPGQRYIPLDK